MANLGAPIDANTMLQSRKRQGRHGPSVSQALSQAVIARELQAQCLLMVSSAFQPFGSHVLSHPRTDAARHVTRSLSRSLPSRSELPLQSLRPPVRSSRWPMPLALSHYHKMHRIAGLQPVCSTCPVSFETSPLLEPVGQCSGAQQPKTAPLSNCRHKFELKAWSQRAMSILEGPS